MLALYVASVPRVWQCEGVDEIDYLSVAHSLSLGMGYTVYGTPHVLYPPLYPLLLSLVYRGMGVGAWRAMYTINAVLGACGWILIATWIRRRFREPGKWAAWFLLLAYYPWSFSCRFLMSEPLFLPISFGLLILVWRVLERNEWRWWECAAIGVLSLLAGMTRAAAISLNTAIVLAGVARWMTSRARAGLTVAVLALTLGIGFFAYWSVRADIVNPHAPESHWRWAKKYLGISEETHGIIAQGEEVTEISAVFHRRVLFAAGRYAQFVASVVRPPRGFGVVGGVAALFFLGGLVRHVRQYPWSPLGWYTVLFLSMILKTTWLSNYLRFYIMIAPFLFLFLAEGMAWWGGLVLQERRSWALTLSGVALVVIVLALWQHGPDLEGQERLYQQVIRWGTVAFCVGLAVWGGWAMRKRELGVAVEKAQAIILIIAALHAGGLIALRAREGWKNTTLRVRKLDGVEACSRWLRESGSGGGRLLATLPQVPSFLSGFVFEEPSYDDLGKLELDGVERVMVIGMLHEVPFFRPAEEARLMQAVARAEHSGELIIERQCGQTTIYRVAGFTEKSRLATSSSVQSFESL